MTKNTNLIGIDLDALESAAAEDLTHKVGVAFNDDGEPTAGFIIVGKDSDQYREAAKKLRVTGIKRQAVKSQRIDTKTDEGAATLERVVSSNEMDLALAVVVGWFGFNSGKQAAPFSADAVRSVFEKRPTWREKVSAALEVEDNFLPKSLVT